ncbi:MAG TPA: MFS transporter [Opitutaceae bacterium]|nr:MFS transporter [Opitutaceae bacterium]
MLHPESSASAPSTPVQARRLRDLSPLQWKSGIAAWLGWLFDGLDMHLYTLVAAPFVSQLLHVASTADPLVREKSSWIQAAFLLGWAVGGGFFGRVADWVGRSRALSLTILTYAVFTGLSFFAETWWQLMIFRFVAALGIGGEWAVGSALLAETWPRAWRPWIAAVLQTGVNVGVLLACGVVWSVAEFSGDSYEPRWVFLAGVAPAFIVYWIRKNVPEPEVWKEAKRNNSGKTPGFTDLFAPGIRRTSLCTIVVCAFSLTGWWAFMFWHVQHLVNLPELASWTAAAKAKLTTTTFFLVIGVSIAGNFFAGWLARRFGYRIAIITMFAGFFIALQGSFLVSRSYQELSYFWFPLVGFCSGVFGLFTMYLPPLFPTLLRTTGAGFCYNIGRVAAAAGTIVFGLFSKIGDFRYTLLCTSYLFIIGIIGTLFLSEPPNEQ